MARVRSFPVVSYQYYVDSSSNFYLLRAGARIHVLRPYRWPRSLAQHGRRNQRVAGLHFQDHRLRRGRQGDDAFVGVPSDAVSLAAGPGRSILLPSMCPKSSFIVQLIVLHRRFRRTRNHCRRRRGSSCDTCTSCWATIRSSGPSTLLLSG